MQPLSQLLAQKLYTARLVVRTDIHGRPHLGNMLRPSVVQLYPQIVAILNALWERQDSRPLSERLAVPGIPQRPEEYHVFLDRLVEDGFLLPSEVDEEQLWYQQLAADVEELPRIDQVELTNACPFTCVFCPRGLGEMTRPVGHLDLELLKDLVAQVAHLPQHKPFGLHHFGDPLLHPAPEKAVAIVSEAGLEAEISFNPILLSMDKARAILEAGVGVVILSLDGLDDETLTAMRGPRAGPTATVLRTIEAFIEMAAGMPKPPTVMVSMVSSIHNQHQWTQLFERYRRAEYPWLTPVVRLLDDFGHPDIAPLRVHGLRQLCGIPFKFVSILYDGTVVPCCHDFNGARPLGNIRRQSLAEIWQSPAVQQFRQDWLAKKFAPGEACCNCRWRPDAFIADKKVALVDAWDARLWYDAGPHGI